MHHCIYRRHITVQAAGGLISATAQYNQISKLAVEQF